MTALLILKIVGLIVGAAASVRAARKAPNAVDKRRSAVLLVALGFGVAVVAELVDTSQKQNSSIEAMNRNNALIAEMKRTIHPLFPLLVAVSFRAPLADDATRSFRMALEQKYQREHQQNPDERIVWLYPEESDFPTYKKDAVAFQIVNAQLVSVVRLYSRQRTKEGRLEQADVEFWLSRLRDSDPSVKKYAVMTDELRRRWIANREYIFRPDQGLYMSDNSQKVDFVDTKNSTDMVSVDDLLGATLEVATESFDPSDDYGQTNIAAQTEWITFESIAITLPGWRQLVIERQRFTPTDPSSDGYLRYRFILPDKKDEFEKLIRNEHFWKIVERG